MIDFLNLILVTLIMALLLAGFLAMAPLLVFELSAVVLFWIKERKSQHPRLT